MKAETKVLCDKMAKVIDSATDKQRAIVERYLRYDIWKTHSNKRFWTEDIFKRKEVARKM